ncbi:MAG: NAD(P)-binding domain-containing protein, partial [Candidatus Omnitrophica bacterium]|nr:NAD(P)-binding domain-containing protein [Candidatus Omnitrophota bacterium]
MKQLNQTIGFIGCGNMGSAILSGLLRHQAVRPKQVYVYDPVSSKRKFVSLKFHVNAVRDNSELIRRSRIVLLAMKPQDLHSAALKLKP